MSSIVLDILYRDNGAAKGLRDVGAAADQTAQKWGKFKTLAAVGALAAGAAILKFGKDSVAAYSDAQASQAKLAFAFQKFPKLADTNQAALQKLNSAMQLKTKFDDDAIASGQAVLAQYNLTGKQLEQVTPLLLDYAAKTGKDLPDAAKAMGRAFLGNTRALKEIGVNYKSTGDQATDFANITGLMRKQVGGFAEAEGKTAAGQLEILKNQFGELQEAAGAKLLPAVVQVTKSLTEAAIFAGKYANVLGPLVGVVGGVAAVIWTANKAQQAWAITQGLTSGLAVKAVGGLNALKVAFTGVALTAEASGKAMRIAQASIPVIGLALVAATTAFASFTNRGALAAQAADDFSSGMQSVAGTVTLATAALNENVRATAAKQLQDKGAFDSAKALGLGLNVVTDAALGQQFAMDLVRRAIADAMGTRSQKDAMDLGRALNLTTAAASSAAQAEQDRRSAMGGGTAATKTAAQAAQDHAAKVKAESDALNTLADEAAAAANSLLQLSGSHIGVEAAIDAATKAAKDNGKTLDLNTSKGRANQQALDSLASATIQYTNGLVKSGASAEKVVAANERGRSSFIKTARAMGASKKEATALANSLFQIPKDIKSQIVVAGGKVSERQAKSLNAALKGIPKEQRSRIVTIANTKGAKAAQAEIKKVKDKQAKIKFETDAKKKAAEANRQSATTKDRKRSIKYDTNAKKTKDQADRETAKAKNRSRKIDVNQNAGDARRSAQASMNAVRNVTRYINVKKRIANADGGYVPHAGLADGGLVRGFGGPREDNIAGIDRRTRVQSVWVSAGEFTVNKKQTDANRAQIETINAGGKWDLVPRRAGGGLVGRGDYVSARSAAGVTYIDNREYHIPNYVGSVPDLIRTLEKAGKRGELGGLKEQLRR